MSLVAHIIVILALALLTFATVQRKPEVVLTATSVDGQDEPIEEFSEVEFEEIDDVGIEDPVLDPEFSELTEIAVSDISMPAAATSAPSNAATANGSSASSQPSASPTTKPGRTSNQQGSVSFYGSKSKGNRFVFVVDNSGSMVNGRMLTTLDQLMSSVNQMTPKQEFYVIFFSDTAYPLYYPNTVDDLVPANKQHKGKLAEWLKTVELCKGGDYETAMKKAFGLHPDVIFLLGDGGGVGQDEMRMMTDPNVTRPTINTFAMGASRAGAEVLSGDCAGEPWIIHAGSGTPSRGSVFSAKPVTLPQGSAGNRLGQAGWAIAEPSLQPIIE